MFREVFLTFPNAFKELIPLVVSFVPTCIMIQSDLSAANVLITARIVPLAPPENSVFLPVGVWITHAHQSY